MTPGLADARKHLQVCQAILDHVRKTHWRGSPWIKDAEKNVLAALSWVWDEQCRECNLADHRWIYVNPIVRGVRDVEGLLSPFDFRKEQERDWSRA